MLNNCFCKIPLDSPCSENVGKVLILYIINKFHVGRQQLYWELQCRHFRGNFPKRIKQYPQLFLLANLSITVRSNPFVRKKKKYRASEFMKKQRNKKSKFFNNRHPEVFLKTDVSNVQKKSWRMKLLAKIRLKSCTALIVSIFEQICWCFTIFANSRYFWWH